MFRHVSGMRAVQVEANWICGRPDVSSINRPTKARAAPASVTVRIAYAANGKRRPYDRMTRPWMFARVSGGSQKVRLETALGASCSRRCADALLGILDLHDGVGVGLEELAHCSAPLVRADWPARRWRIRDTIVQVERCDEGDGLVQVLQHRNARRPAHDRGENLVEQGGVPSEQVLDVRRKVEIVDGVDEDAGQLRQRGHPDVVENVRLWTARRKRLVELRGKRMGLRPLRCGRRGAGDRLNQDRKWTGH